MIEGWENENGVTVPKGVYPEHWNDQAYIYGNRRMDFNIATGRNVYQFKSKDTKKTFKKPVVCSRNGMNSFYIGSPETHDQNRVDDANHYRKRFYMWLSLMFKVQYAGFIGNRPWGADFKSENATIFGKQMRFTTETFEAIQDYASMEDGFFKLNAKPVFYNLALVSSTEALIYLHTEDYHAKVSAGAKTGLKSLDIPDGPVRVEIRHPATGKIEAKEMKIMDGEICVELPEFREDIAILIQKM